MGEGTYNLIPGFIRDTMNNPIANAEVHIIENNITLYANGEGRYNITVKPGRYTVRVQSEGYESSVKYVDVPDIIMIPKVVIFTLDKDTSVFGIPRLVFVIFSGKYTL